MTTWCMNERMKRLCDIVCTYYKLFVDYTTQPDRIFTRNYGKQANSK